MLSSPSTILVTGLPRSGTSWVGKMLEASGEIVYVNEPLNPSHPPGRSPGVLNAEVEHYFQYICAANEKTWLAAYRDTVQLRYRLGAELRRNRSLYDVARAAKYQRAFRSGRRHGRAALLDDPYATLSVAWLVDRLDVRAVVLVRNPVSFVGSWGTLGWSVDPGELLAQEHLMRDHLEPFRPELESLAGSDDWLAMACLLWRVTYYVVGEIAATRPGVMLRRYESYAEDPVGAFRGLYADLQLSWSPEVEESIRSATSSGSAGRRGFRWSWRGTPSRTAFQPMDSRKSLTSYASRLDASQIDRVLDLTQDVRPDFYPA